MVLLSVKDQIRLKIFFLDEATADDSLEVLNTEINCDSLECDITEVEVRDAIQSLKSGKAPGPDGLNGEFYKYSAHCVVAFLTKYFNKLFDSGTVDTTALVRVDHTSTS